ncbi:MAG: hypothetical protein AAFN70_05335, partial [Planctomycetota bacterium]
MIESFNDFGTVGSSWWAFWAGVQCGVVSLLRSWVVCLFVCLLACCSAGFRSFGALVSSPLLSLGTPRCVLLLLRSFGIRFASAVL